MHTCASTFIHIYMYIYTYIYIYTYEYIYIIRALVNSRHAKQVSFAKTVKKIHLFCKNFQETTSLLQTLARKNIFFANTLKIIHLFCKHFQENTLLFKNYQERPLITSPGQTHFKKRHVVVILLMISSVLGAGIRTESNTPLIDNLVVKVREKTAPHSYRSMHKRVRDGS